MEEQMDWKAIHNARNRINDSLDMRFEQNTSMYIPIYKIEAMKRELYEKKYHRLKGYYIAKELSPELLVKIILSNTWLICDVNYKIYNESFKDIFSNCDFEYLKSVMKDVINDKIDMEERFRLAILNTYVERLSVADCIAMINAKNKLLRDDGILNICIKKVMFESNLNKQSKIAFLYKAMRLYPTLIRIMNDKYYDFDITNLLTESEWMSVFSAELLNNMKDSKEGDPISAYWISFFIKNFPSVLFDEVMEYIEENQYTLERNETRDFLHIFGIRRYFNVRFKDYISYLNKFVKSFKNITVYQVKFDLISYIGTLYDRNIRDALFRLIETDVYALNNRGISTHYQNVMNNSKTKTQNSIECMDDLYQSLEDSDDEIADSYARTLAFAFRNYHDEKNERELRDLYNSSNTVNGAKILGTLVEQFKWKYLEDILNLYEDGLTEKLFCSYLYDAIEKTNLHKSTKGKLRDKLYNFMKQVDFNRYRKLNARI